MKRQSAPLDLSWARGSVGPQGPPLGSTSHGPNAAADTDFQGILVEVFHCPACRAVATRPMTITLSSRGVDLVQAV
ncbi:MAG TPA: hypothetical protein VK416_08315 [Thermoanaerobaculia bacterium]|nr:hypothetical protein [Thermoanaerobaculia bacterium]